MTTRAGPTVRGREGLNKGLGAREGGDSGDRGPRCRPQLPAVPGAPGPGGPRTRRRRDVTRATSTPGGGEGAVSVASAVGSKAGPGLSAPQSERILAR